MSFLSCTWGQADRANGDMARGDKANHEKVKQIFFVK